MPSTTSFSGRDYEVFSAEDIALMYKHGGRLVRRSRYDLFATLERDDFPWKSAEVDAFKRAAAQSDAFKALVETLISDDTPRHDLTELHLTRLPLELAPLIGFAAPEGSPLAERCRMAFRVANAMERWSGVGQDPHRSYRTAKANGADFETALKSMEWEPEPSPASPNTPGHPEARQPAGLDKSGLSRPPSR
jgi:hypothetical protein